ncbi:MAG: MltA domain-containing protein [Rickettsiales bacterium]|nr:MltA domain-containing protein [Rickettsiales bacterium]
MRKKFFSVKNNGIIFERVDYSNLEGWGQDDYLGALDGLLQSCGKIVSRGRGEISFPQLGLGAKNSDFFGICKIAELMKRGKYDNDHARIFFETYFVPYRVIDLKSTKSLFTGYYIPKILAKKSKDHIFRYPIYKKPPDLVNGIRYYSREQIYGGALDNKNLEILYTDDPIELYFMHIQGSGMVKLADENRLVYVGYGGKNNCNYSAPNMTVNGRGIKMNKQELKKNIEETMKLLSLNESYVFFRFLNNNEFTGAFGTKLIPERTMAVDSRYIPLGFPLWLSTEHTKKFSKKKFNRLMFANDVGAAIRGVNRGDIFFGFGKKGEEDSVGQYAGGQYFLLIPINMAKKL